MICKPCVNAMSNPRADEYTNGCFSCRARALAQIGGDPEDRGVLERLFGDEWEQGREQVKTWIGRILAASKRKVTP